MKCLAIAGYMLLLSACRVASSPTVVTRQPTPVHLAQCVGPATSLPDSLARGLPPRTGRMQPDDSWADLARTIPGGFAGTIYDSTHSPVLMLTQPALAASAKQALVGRLAFPITDATVREARWDFAQLVDWFNYLLPRLTIGAAMADKDESINRIRFTVTSIAVRDSLVRAVSALSTL